MSHPRLLAALYRSPSYSPNQHRTNDTAIMDATVRHLLERGWQVHRLAEPEVEQGRVPAADLYVNMCQGPIASERLVPIEADGALVVNSASSVLNCHRHRLVRHMIVSHLPFPLTLILNTGADDATLRERLEPVFEPEAPVWVKRGDVHAERTEDVVPVRVEEVPLAFRAFAERGIRWAAVQEHIPGPVLKFYAVAGRRFFRWYGAEAGPTGSRPAVDEGRMQDLAFAAAEVLGLEVFGGDVAVPSPGHPVLIDINDWPSFAPFREDAAAAIADYIAWKATNG
jgi:hypothetical protein